MTIAGKTNVTIGGLPSYPNEEKAVQAVFELAEEVGHILTGTDIYAAHSLPSSSGPPRLLVKFTSRMIKLVFVSQLKAKKVSTHTGNGWA